MLSQGLAGLLAQAGDTFWLPPPDSTTAPLVDSLFYFLLWLSTFFFVLIVSLMCLFVLLYRRRPGKEPSESPSHNTPLEILWSVIPLILVIFIFYKGFVGYLDMRLPPRESYEIKVIARKWAWQFKYANGHDAIELHVPADRPVRLIMRSEDVIHSLAIPDFRVKMDIVPGRYTKTWFRAPKSGTHTLYCTEYCGTGHSDMVTTVVVHPPGEFEQWLEDAARFAANLTPAQRGERLWRSQGCFRCHTTDGKASTGPSFQGIWGETHEFTRGAPAVVDENYIRESILDPRAKVRAGYKDQMNSYRGQLSDEQIDDIIALIKSLKVGEE